MCKDVEVILLQLVCRLPECRKNFHICHSCYRGHSYCSHRCRTIARRRQLKAANLRYNKTPEARQDRSDRQRAWRERQKLRVPCSHNDFVMYQGSILFLAVAVSVCHWIFNRQRAILEEKSRALHLSGLSRCIICGRVSRLVTPFFIKRRPYP